MTVLKMLTKIDTSDVYKLDKRNMPAAIIKPIKIAMEPNR